MLMQGATPEMVERWKEVWNEYKDKLLPNRKSGKEVVEYLKNKYLLEELHDDNANQVVINNVLYNKPYADKLSMGEEMSADDRKIVGTSGMSFVEKPPYYSNPYGKIGLLSSMYTLKEYRKKGITKELLDRVVNEAKDYGCGVVQITASDMGVLLYTDYGFKKNKNFMQYTF
jgi:GNAT superfamily N-acetyltransferase